MNPEPISSLPRKVAEDTLLKRAFFLLEIESLEDERLKNLETEPFTCFCALDASKLSVQLISDFCVRLLRAGCLYFCVWGPDCERVHDIMDENIVMMDIAGEDLPISFCHFEDFSGVMTTWHSDEPITEALYFFTQCAILDAPCKGLMLSVNSPEWSSEIESYVSSEYKYK